MAKSAPKAPRANDMVGLPHAFVAYVPVIHRGYLAFFDRYPDVRTLYVCGRSILEREDYLRKDLRALTPDDQVRILRATGRFDSVQVLEWPDVADLTARHGRLVLPDEDISRQIAAEWKTNQYELSPVFLRWDRQAANAEMDGAEVAITAGEFEQNVMREALQVAGHSSDIWRRLGAVLITANGQRVGPAPNTGEPTPHSPWMEGDPRNIFSRGVGIEMSVFTHAEAVVIAEAARSGISLQGATIFVSTFPCPACAKLIARSGIAACYYRDGYAVLDGRRILEEYGVKLVRVQLDDTADPRGDTPNGAAILYPSPKE
jgi:dCMP deaminase